MDPVALALVLLSACLHAGWNLLAKRLHGGFGVAWCYSFIGTLALTPLGLLWWRMAEPSLTPLHWGFLMGSAVLHVGYLVSLQKGYGLGDLSLVYPLARGTGPALATAMAVLFLGERPGPFTVAGTGLVALSAFGLAGRSFRVSPRAVRMGLLTGAFIACYTVWDATAVSRAGLAPILYLWLADALRTLILTPFAWRRKEELRRAWREGRGALIGVGILSPAAYLLVLEAFRLAPVSSVAPAREVSILIGAILGAGLLRETDAGRRLLSAAGMAVGVALLTRG